MFDLTALHFLRPHWLWALAALPVLAWAWRAQRQRRSAWRGHVDAHLLPHLLVTGGSGARAGVVVAAMAYVLAVLALAGPSWRQADQPLWQAQRPLVVVLDLSSRITAADLPPSRLLQARATMARRSFSIFSLSFLDVMASCTSPSWVTDNALPKLKMS